MPPLARSFNAARYEGFEESSALVLGSMASIRPDLVVGHSQGAILVAALMSLGSIKVHPRVGYVLNGVAWPNPFTSELGGLPPDALRGARVLVLSGERDAINPPDQARRVAEALEKAGADLTFVAHPGGHAIPSASRGSPEDDDATLDRIRAWIQGGRSLASGP
jgi:pimeloyl-ACP methyl ester carboxylesterase